MWLLLYIVISWLSNFFFWIRVSCCIFLYYYMGVLVFVILGFFWWVDRWLNSWKVVYRMMGVIIIFIVLCVFVFWMFVYLGLVLFL